MNNNRKKQSEDWSILQIRKHRSLHQKDYFLNQTLVLISFFTEHWKAMSVLTVKEPMSRNRKCRHLSILRAICLHLLYLNKCFPIANSYEHIIGNWIYRQKVLYFQFLTLNSVIHAYEVLPQLLSSLNIHTGF